MDLSLAELATLLVALATLVRALTGLSRVWASPRRRRA
jgi:hypothetical protein